MAKINGPHQSHLAAFSYLAKAWRNENGSGAKKKKWRLALAAYGNRLFPRRKAISRNVASSCEAAARRRRRLCREMKKRNSSLHQAENSAMLSAEKKAQKKTRLYLEKINGESGWPAKYNVAAWRMAS
jgi:hypothetical protein